MPPAKLSMIEIASAVLAVALTLLLLARARRRTRLADGKPQVRILGTYSPVATWIRYRAVPVVQQQLAPLGRTLKNPRVSGALEIAVIAVWCLWLGRKFLDFDPQVWPVGREFGIQVYGFHFWEQFWRCGTCSLWNGMFNGGSPFLADPFTGALHPLSAIAGSLAGAVNGAKLTALGSIFMAGIAQWWLARVMGLGRWSRMWVALAASSGGHLLGRMELGSVNLVLSTAATSLALAGGVDLAIHRTRRAAVRLAILLALSYVAGVAYLQIALLLWAPWIAAIAWDRTAAHRLPWKEFALAAGLSVMIAATFLVPFLHVWPSLAKFVDPSFATSQPFGYVPLNLVIHDWDFYLAGVPGGTDFPYLHTLYIGWPAVLLAGVGLARSRVPDRRLLFSLGLGALTMFWLASGDPFRWASAILPGVAGVRHPALMAGLAVPAVLAIAGYGLDRVLELRWPAHDLAAGPNRPRPGLRLLASILLALPLLAALAAADRLDQHFLETYDVSGAYRVIPVLKTADLAWVSPPFGEHYWIEPGLAAGLKIANAVSPFWWTGRDLPPPALEAVRGGLPAEFTPVAYLDDVPVYAHPDANYAYVENGPARTPCSAQGTGGDLTIRCDSDGGRLIVYENAWTGWTASINNTPAELGGGPWLTVNVPPGMATVRFRYLPLDALAGILMTFAGWILAVWLWRRERSRRTPPEPSASSADPHKDETRARSPSPVIVILLILGAAAVLTGQIVLRTFPGRPIYEFAIPTICGLLLLAWGSSNAVLDRLPPSRAISLRRWADPRQSRLPLYVAGLVAALVATLLAGDEVLIRLPGLAVGFWLVGIAAVLWAASAVARPSLPSSRLELVGLLLLVLAAAIVRIVRLGDIPWLLAGDEASVGMSAREFLDGVWTNPFRVAWYSFPSLFFLIPAASIGVLGQTISALRLPAAIAGILTVVALFFYARSSFGRTMAFFSAGYLVVFHFHIHFSRIALNNIWDALLFTLFSYFLWRAWSEERPALFAWAGVVAGLAQYFYTSTRFLIVLVPIWMAIAWLVDRERSRRVAKSWLVLLAAALVVVLPLAVFFARHPAEFTAPMVRVSLFGPWLTNELAVTGLPAWRILLGRIGLSAMAFSLANLRHWYTIDRPMLLPLPATLFLVGLGISVVRARDLRYVWLLLWLAIGVMAGGLSESTPAAQRYIFLAPAVAVLVALPLAELVRRFPQATPRRRALLTAGAAAVLLVAAVLDLRFYFVEYTPSRRFSDMNTEVAQNLGQYLLAKGLDEGVQIYFSGQPRMGYRSIETLPYLVPGDSFTDILEPLTAPPEWPVARPAAFVFLPENVGDLAWVEQAYPGGEPVTRFGSGGAELYTIYLLH